MVDAERRAKAHRKVVVRVGQRLIVVATHKRFDGLIQTEAFYARVTKTDGWNAEYVKTKIISEENMLAPEKGGTVTKGGGFSLGFTRGFHAKHGTIILDETEGA